MFSNARNDTDSGFSEHPLGVNFGFFDIPAAARTFGYTPSGSGGARGGGCTGWWVPGGMGPGHGASLGGAPWYGSGCLSWPCFAVFWPCFGLFSRVLPVFWPVFPCFGPISWFFGPVSWYLALFPGIWPISRFFGCTGPFVGCTGPFVGCTGPFVGCTGPCGWLAEVLVVGWLRSWWWPG